MKYLYSYNPVNNGVVNRIIQKPVSPVIINEILDHVLTENAKRQLFRSADMKQDE